MGQELEDLFQRLTADHEILPFDCGDHDINDFLLTDAKDYLRQHLAVTYILEKSNKTILYFTLSNDKITSVESTDSFWRKIKRLFPHSKHRKDYPAVKIGRLGIHSDYQHTDEHWGSLVIDYIKHSMISHNKTGCRFITVDAYRAAVPFYQSNGFKFMGASEKERYDKGKGQTIAMYYDLIEIMSD